MNEGPPVKEKFRKHGLVTFRDDLTAEQIALLKDRFDLNAVHKVYEIDSDESGTWVTLVPPEVTEEEVQATEVLLFPVDVRLLKIASPPH